MLCRNYGVGILDCPPSFLFKRQILQIRPLDLIISYNQQSRSLRMPFLRRVIGV